MIPYSIHSMTLESPTHSLVYDSFWTHVGDVAASWFLPSSQTKTSGSGPNIQRRLTKNLSFSLSDNITLWLMTQFLPPNLLALFAPREPIPYLPPSSKLPTEKKNVHVS